MFKNPIMVVIYFVVLVTISWQLTVFALLLLPIAGGLIGYIGKTLKRSRCSDRHRQAKCSAR
jgi:ABC-type multidrug transport system fused ATPase/permease subunit